MAKELRNKQIFTMEKLLLSEESVEALQQPEQQKKSRKWNSDQNFVYACYLEENFMDLEFTKKRRSTKFFIKMAERMKNGKNNEQCRSHHQKMLQKFGSVENIISIFKKFKGVPMGKSRAKSAEEVRSCQQIDTRLNSDTNNEKDLEQDRFETPVQLKMIILNQSEKLASEQFFFQTQNPCFFQIF